MLHIMSLLYRLFQEERRLSHLDDPSVPQGVLTYKHATMRYAKKDGTISVYHYAYPYLRVDKKQRYLKPGERERICFIMQIREVRKMISKGIRRLMRLLFDRLPKPEQPKEAELREAYYAASQEAEDHRASKRGAVASEEYLSAQGDRMQSREECMTADNLYAMGIPYKYEPKVPTPEGQYGYRSPDFEVFTFGKRYFMELMGVVDNPEYEAKIREKLKDYEKVDVRSGENLLLFRNTQRYGIDGKKLWETIMNTLNGELPKGMVYI